MSSVRRKRVIFAVMNRYIKVCLFPTFLLFLPSVLYAQQWRVGEWVTDSIVASRPLESWFTAEPISEAVQQRMEGRSYPKDCPILLSDLRYLRLLYRDIKGQARMGEMVVNKAIAADAVNIFRELFLMGYPIECMQLIDDYDANDERSMTANNTSAFCFRAVAGSKRLSAHARGMAIDVNPLYNPCVRHRRDGSLWVQPASGKKYANREHKTNYMISDAVVALFRKYGFRWGGAWRSVKDYQHFEK